MRCPQTDEPAEGNPCWVVKGTNSTRSNVMQRWSGIGRNSKRSPRPLQASEAHASFLTLHVFCSLTAAEIVHTMREAVLKATKQCGRQTGFLIQPFMLGLQWECRSYFNRGEYMFSLMSDQPHMHGTKEQKASALNTVSASAAVTSNSAGLAVHAHARFATVCPCVRSKCAEPLVSRSGSYFKLQPARSDSAEVLTHLCLFVCSPM